MLLLIFFHLSHTDDYNYSFSPVFVSLSVWWTVLLWEAAISAKRVSILGSCWCNWVRQGIGVSNRFRHPQRLIFLMENNIILIFPYFWNESFHLCFPRWEGFGKCTQEGHEMGAASRENGATQPAKTMPDKSLFFIRTWFNSKLPIPARGWRSHHFDCTGKSGVPCPRGPSSVLTWRGPGQMEDMEAYPLWESTFFPEVESSRPNPAQIYKNRSWAFQSD